MRTTICASCKAQLDNSSHFCKHCGSAVSDSAELSVKGSRALAIPNPPAHGNLKHAGQMREEQVLAEYDITLINGDEVYNYVLSSSQAEVEGQEIEQQPTKPLDSDTGFLPIPPSGFTQSPHGNAPVVQVTPHLDRVPSVNGTPSVPGNSAGQSAAGSSPSTPAQSQPPSAIGHSHHPSPSQGLQHSPAASSPHSTMQLSHTPYAGWQANHSSSHLHHDRQAPHHRQHLHHHEQNRHHQEPSSPPPLLAPTRKTKHPGKWRPNLLMAMLAGVVIMSGVLAALLLWPHGAATRPALMLRGKVAPGGLLSVHGSNFTAGGNITLTIDGQPATVIGSSSTHQAAYGVNALASLSLNMYQAPTVPAAGSTIAVKSNGTFDVTIQLDPRWLAGSSHLLVATERSSGQTGQYKIVIPQQPALVSCSKSTDTIARTLGPVNEGQKQAVFVPFALCTIGSGTVNWTASWNQKQAKWLQLTQTGHILAPLRQDLQVGASAEGLKAGIYDSMVTFSSQDSVTKIFVKVTFIVRSANAQECMNTNVQSLSFTATQGQTAPRSQSVTITNCGKTSSWIASTSTDDGAKWLNISPSAGSNLKSKASQNVSIAASSVNLGVGTYTGQVTFKVGSGTAANMAVVDVMLTVLPSNTSCISVGSQLLSFMAFQGQNGSGPQTATIGSCGSAGSWSASTSTNWLSISPSNGLLNANAMQNVTVRVSNVNLQIGKYIGQITFTSGTSSAIVTVSLTIQQLQQKPCISVTNQALSFTNTQGQGDPLAQSVTLTNCGPTDSWSANTSAGANWLRINPVTGNLSGGGLQTVSIAVSSGNLEAGMYKGQITFKTKSGASTAVNVTWNLQPLPTCIRTSTQTLNFTAIQQEGDPAAQSVTLTNCGPTGTWSGLVSDGANWLSINPSSRDLTAGQMQDVPVIISSTGLGAASYTGSITFTITTTSGTSQATVQVSLTVSPPPQPCIKVDQSSLNFIVPAGGNHPPSQSITLTNCGPAGTWSYSVSLDGNNANGLSIDVNPSSTALGEEATQPVSISVACSAGEGYNCQYGGTFGGTITFALGSSTATVQVTLTVQNPPCLVITQVNGQQVASDGPVTSTEVFGPSNMITVTNCGDAGNLMASVSDNTLSTDLPQNFTLNAGGTQNITITSNGSDGVVTLVLNTDAGSASVTVNVHPGS